MSDINTDKTFFGKTVFAEELYPDTDTVRTTAYWVLHGPANEVSPRADLYVTTPDNYTPPATFAPDTEPVDTFVWFQLPTHVQQAFADHCKRVGSWGDELQDRVGDDDPPGLGEQLGVDGEP